MSSPLSAHTRERQRSCPTTFPCRTLLDSHTVRLPGCNTGMPVGRNGHCSPPPSRRRKLELICLLLPCLLSVSRNDLWYFSNSNYEVAKTPHSYSCWWYLSSYSRTWYNLYLSFIVFKSGLLGRKKMGKGESLFVCLFFHFFMALPACLLVFSTVLN